VDVVINFIVFKKAFDIIQRNLLLNIFRSYNNNNNNRHIGFTKRHKCLGYRGAGISLPDKIANIIRNLY